ncbi:hypothetical protein MTR_2g033985 [Medicago truncatula]|uniref:Uncharacterized protein n=1 Tax=Medicago truncatula TaxID=3880 RepID=A0A072V704_MEDTR|nr:hypothetical protein MTR_2g033985 [Medicago truncatula]
MEFHYLQNLTIEAQEVPEYTKVKRILLFTQTFLLIFKVNDQNAPTKRESKSKELHQQSDKRNKSYAEEFY